MEVNKKKINQILASQGTYREKYHAIYGEWVDKDTARYRINRLSKGLSWHDMPNLQRPKTKHNVEFVKDERVRAVNDYSVVINADNTQSSQKLIECSTEEMKDPMFLLHAHGYDPKRFELISAASSMWQNGSNKGDKTLYSSRIKVRPIEDETIVLKNIQECIKLAFKDNQTPRAKAVKKSKPNRTLPGGFDESDNMLEICVPDLHIGLSENEDGEYSLFASEELIADKNIEMRRLVETSDCNRVVIAFLGDLLHYDTAHKTTTKGTPQCSNVSFEQTFSSAIRIVRDMVDNVVEALVEKQSDDVSVHIVYIPGNHDTILGYTLMSVLKAYFHDNEIVTFDIRQINRKYLQFGTNLIGFIHGDMNPKRINQWLYTEARHCISDAESIEIHCGHLHSEQVVEDNGVIVRHLPTVCGVSPWESQQGYHSKRRLTAFLWNAVNGLKSVFYF